MKTSLKSRLLKQAKGDVLFNEGGGNATSYDAEDMTCISTVMQNFVTRTTEAKNSERVLAPSSAIPLMF